MHLKPVITAATTLALLIAPIGTIVLVVVAVLVLALASREYHWRPRKY
jgi:hypothetical protein